MYVVISGQFNSFLLKSVSPQEKKIYIYNIDELTEDICCTVNT